MPSYTCAVTGRRAKIVKPRQVPNLTPGHNSYFGIPSVYFRKFFFSVSHFTMFHVKPGHVGRFTPHLLTSFSQGENFSPFKAYRSRDAPRVEHSKIVRSAHTIYVFCIYLSTNSDLCHLYNKLICFYNRDEKCLLRGTNWVFK